MRHFKVLVPGIVAATAILVAANAGSQTLAPPAPSPATTSPHAAAMTRHHKATAAKTTHDAEMKQECEAMMAKKQEMQGKVQAIDATLDKLVAEMNATKGSKEVDAMEKPMAAVLNELVAQRKVLRSMMMEMQPAMMAHEVHHMHTHGAKGAMECPMMKTDSPPEPKAEKKLPM